MPALSKLQTAIDSIKATLNDKQLMLFLDYDGTLAEINSVPDNTYMSKDMKQLLTDISGLGEVVVVPISGRKTEDLRDRIGIPGIAYAGNHGLEMDLHGGQMTYNLDEEELGELRHNIKNIVKELRERKLGRECGGNIEEKDTALTWHFFNVAANEVEQTVEEACEVVRRHGMPVFDGEGCIEVRHPKITKGDAMKKILVEKLGEAWHETHHALFIGDSSSDEEGYAALLQDADFRSDCVTFVKVQTDNQKPTRAQHVVRGPDDVYSLLCALNSFYNPSHIVS